jgi:hypothetical protein
VGVFTFQHNGKPYRLERNLELLPPKKRVGDIGEFLAPILLTSVGFKNIVDLNRRKANHEDADFLAERNGTYFISVKARNKWERGDDLNKRCLNNRYKLESTGRKIEDCLATGKSFNAEFAWVTVQIDNSTYCAYFGTHAQLLIRGTNGKGVNMSEAHTAHYEVLATNEPHNVPASLISNLGLRR